MITLKTLKPSLAPQAAVTPKSLSSPEGLHGHTGSYGLHRGLDGGRKGLFRSLSDLYEAFVGLHRTIFGFQRAVGGDDGSAASRQSTVKASERPQAALTVPARIKALAKALARALEGF